MELYRAGKSREASVYKLIAVILFLFTAAGVVAIVNWSNGKDFADAQPVLLAGTAILTVTLFLGFGMYGKSSWIRNYETLNIFTMDEAGALYRVFYTSADTGGDKFTYLPATTVGKAVSISNSAKAISNIREKGDFLKSEKLSEYIKGILEETMEMDKFVRIHLIENPGIVSEKKGKTEFFYTVGKHKQVQNAVLYESYQGYETILNWLKTHAAKDINYRGRKAGDCLGEV